MSAQALESGGDGLAGSLGDGTGKWQLFVSADAAIEVTSLLESPTGHLSNLSAPGLREMSGGRRELELALFMPASDEVRQGFARLLNHSDESGTVRIYGIDDEGRWSGPVVLTLGAGAAAHVNSGDLERGNAAKGLAGALGSGEGSWRLRLYTELDLEALAYVRTSDGFVTTMHERVRESAMRHHVAFFNPGSNRSQVSRLRLINPGEDEVEVTITGRDDEGEPAPGGEVRLTLGPGEARELSAQALESGGDALVGRLGDGTGKWQLFVSSDAAIEVMNLLRSPTGHLANLSVSGQAGVVNEGGIDEPVGLHIVVDIPSEVTAVRAGDLTTMVLGPHGDGAPPGGAPALLVASDADGAVLYALVSEDGGMLGEAPGTVRVSVASTAVVLVALAAGYRVPSVTPEAVDAILSHAGFGALTRALSRLMEADKRYLTRLSDYPDVVGVMQRMAGSLTGDRRRGRGGRSGRSAPDARSALPDGIVKENFYCTPLTEWPCSPVGRARAVAVVRQRTRRRGVLSGRDELGGLLSRGRARRGVRGGLRGLPRGGDAPALSRPLRSTRFARGARRGEPELCRLRDGDSTRGRSFAAHTTRPATRRRWTSCATPARPIARSSPETAASSAPISTGCGSSATG